MQQQQIEVSMLYRWGYGVTVTGTYQFDTMQELAEHLTNTIGPENIRTIIFNN